MENCKIEILPRAWEDLTSIEDFYYLEYGIESAQKVSDSILESIETLEEFPNIDVFTPDERLNQLGYRMFVINQKYVAIIKHVDKKYIFIELLTQKGITISYFCNVLSIYIYLMKYQRVMVIYMTLLLNKYSKNYAKARSFRFG